MENAKAELLTGYMFFHHPERPTLGILRLDTKPAEGESGAQWVMVTRKGLIELAKACMKHADELEEVQ